MRGLRSRVFKSDCALLTMAFFLGLLLVPGCGGTGGVSSGDGGEAPTGPSRLQVGAPQT